MRHHGTYAALLLAFLGQFVQSSVGLAQSVGPTDEKERSSSLQYDERVSDFIAERVLEFAHDIGHELIKEDPGSKSHVFSPTSVMSVLALLMLGARGSTYQELQEVFQLQNSAELLNAPTQFYTELAYLLEDTQSSDGINGSSRVRKNANWRYTKAPEDLRTSTETFEQSQQLTKIANGLFPQVGLSLNPDYLYVLQSLYSSILEPLDFQAQPEEARDLINRWVERNTLGKIPELIKESLPKDSKLIIANTLYFKAFWENAFIRTVRGKFYPNGLHKTPVDAEMMWNGGVFPFYDSAAYGCRIIGFPYKDNRTTMYVIQPNESTPSKLRELQLLLNASRMEELISKMEKKTAVVVFPKMSLSSSFNLKSTLRHVGVVDIFTRGVSDLSLLDSETSCDVAPLKLSRAALNKVSLGNLESDRVRASYGKSNLFVDEIVHQVKVDITAKGTEAAAATRGSLRRARPDVAFKADTPFMFLIRHDPTKLVLFYGVVNEPEL